MHVAVTRETCPVGHRVSCPDFMGRAEELDLLEAIFNRAAGGGRPMTVLISGEAGIGKSRLVEEFCARVRSGGPLTATGVCVPSDGGGLPYGPVVGIVRDVVRQLGEPAAAELLGSVTHQLGLDATGSDLEPESPAGDLARTRLFESILSFVTRLAQRAPVVLVFEDLQWADSASAELLDFMARNLQETSALLVGTYRREEVRLDHPRHRWLTELGRHHRSVQVRLEGLDRDEMAGMIAGILGQPPAWTLVDAVWARSQGNPFFAEELTAARDDPALSPELQEVILSRLQTISREGQEVLHLVAAAGPSVSHQLLVAARGPGAAAALDRSLAEAVDQQILVVDSSQTGYRFRHALLGEAVYSALLPGERIRLHRELAVALRADRSLGSPGPGHSSAQLARHWWAAGEWSEALEASIVAADAAIAVWAFPEALAHLEHALTATDRVAAESAPSGTDLLQLLGKAADIAYLAGAGPRSVDLARAAIDQAEADGDASSAARFYTLLGRNAWGIGDSDAAFGAYRKAVALLPADPPSVELAGVLAEEARGLMLMSRHRDAEQRCDEAIAAARAVDAPAAEGHALNTLGCCRAALGRIDEGIEFLHQALAIAKRLDSPDDLDRAYTNLSALLVDAGRLEEGATLVFDSLEDGDRLGFLKLNGAAANSAHALVRLGRYREAEALIAQMGDRGIGICATAPQLVPAPMMIRQGRFDEAESLLSDADQLTAQLADVQTRGLFHIQSAELALEQGRPDAAYEEIERALTLAAGTDDYTFSLEMCALGIRALADRLDETRARGRGLDADKAGLLALQLVEEAERLVDVPAAREGQCPPRARAFASMCAAERSRLRQSQPDLWEAAAAGWDAAGEPHPAAYCRWRQAEAILEGGGGRSRAIQCLQAAWQASTELGVGPLGARIEQLAQRARIPLPSNSDDAAADRSTVGADLALTPREVEVLGQLAAGRTDREIAEALFISKKTASVHVSNLLRKLDVSNRVEAGKVGQAHGLG
jgi:DNA-binding CsgD family transcriptional regulator/tetratricopeptide (TPR) repeat protein